MFRDKGTLNIISYIMVYTLSSPLPSMLMRAVVHVGSKLVSGFPFIGHENHNNTLESSCIYLNCIWSERVLS
jgi:hypothetical protein